jgi:hypothetical protein
MEWPDVFDKLDKWVGELMMPAYALRKIALDIYTSVPVGIYLDPEDGHAALYGAQASPTDYARCKLACDLYARTRAEPLSLANFEYPWVKVGESNTLNQIGQALNWFPGQYPGGIPNHASPLAAMLTSGLLGAGLGYGAGKLAKKFLPRGYGENLGRTGLILGGLVGAAPGALWGANALANNQSLLGQWPHPAPGETVKEIQIPHGGQHFGPETLPSSPFQHYMEQLRGSQPTRHASVPTDNVHVAGDVVLSEQYQGAVDRFLKRAFGEDEVPEIPPADVNIGEIGNTLVQLGAPSGLAATTLGALYAAQQLPDQRATPGWATSGQLGLLAANLGNDPRRGRLVGAAINAVKDYAKGFAGGAILNSTIGTPYRNSTFGAANMALGALGAVVSRLFGG